MSCIITITYNRYYISNKNINCKRDTNLTFLNLQCKVTTENLEHFENHFEKHIFLELFGNNVYRIVYHCKACSFCFTMLPHL